MNYPHPMDDKTGFETAHDEADALRAWAEDEQRKREKVQPEFNSIRKKERSLRKFLGIKEESKETAAA